MSDDKTEKATPKKIKQAREKGQVAFSKDFASAGALMGALVAANVFWRSSFEVAKNLYISVFDQATRGRGEAINLPVICISFFREFIEMVLPAVVGSVLGALLMGAIQVGIKLSMDPIQPNFERLNPVGGFKNLFTAKKFLEVIKPVLCLMVMILIAYSSRDSIISAATSLKSSSPSQALYLMTATQNKLAFEIAGLLMIMGALDYGLQIYMHKRDQRMSKDEIKKEYKEDEGDPHVKAQRKRISREASNDIAKTKSNRPANLVITNPTHYAVALRYHPETDPVPVIVEKGTDDEAARIREQAMSIGIPVIEDPPTARALYLVPIGVIIPEALFEPVAKIISWLPNLSGNVSSDDNVEMR